MPLFRYTHTIYDDSMFGHFGITPEGLNIIARSWIYGVMFPNLRHAVIYSSSFLLAFFPIKVTAIHIVPARTMDSFTSCAGVITALSRHTPNLKSLTISPGELRDGPKIDHAQFQLSLGAVYGRWQHLQHISFPLYYLTPSQLYALALLPNLEAIDISTTPMISNPIVPGWSGPVELTKPFLGSESISEPVLPVGAFPSLHRFGIGLMSPVAAIRLLRQPHFPVAQIADLFFRISGPTNRRMSCSIRRIISILVERQSPVQDLTINTFAVEGSSPTAISMADQVDYADLKMLRNLPHLRHFRVWHNFPLTLTEDQFFDLTDGWNIETLILNPSPVVAANSHLTLLSLIVAAQNCPNLVELGLFVDAMENDIPCSIPEKPMKHLQRLFLGSSHIVLSDVQRSRSITNFLSTLTEHPYTLVPRNMEIRFGGMEKCVVISDADGSLEFDEDDRQFWTDEEWSFVGRSLVTVRERDDAKTRIKSLVCQSVLSRIREIKKDAKIRTLEREILDLKRLLSIP